MQIVNFCGASNWGHCGFLQFWGVVLEFQVISWVHLQGNLFFWGGGNTGLTGRLPRTPCNSYADPVHLHSVENCLTWLLTLSSPSLTFGTSAGSPDSTFGTNTVAMHTLSLIILHCTNGHNWHCLELSVSILVTPFVNYTGELPALSL